jgi:hypothetical protein
MPFYTGKTADGSDMLQTGVYLSPDGNEWSNKPYTEEQKMKEKEHNIHWKVFDHISGKRTLRDEYDLIKEKKSTLSKTCRDYVKQIIESEESS